MTRTVVARLLVSAVAVLGIPPHSVRAQEPSNRTAAEAMRPLNALAGTWKLTGTIRWGPRDSFVPLDAEPLRIASSLKDRFVDMTVTVKQGPTLLTMQFYWSYDHFQQRYRVAALDDQVGLLDTYVGKGPNPIVVDNLVANTFWIGPFAGKDSRMHTRMYLELRDTEAFGLRQEITPDSGRTWLPFLTATAQRISRTP